MGAQPHEYEVPWQLPGLSAQEAKREGKMSPASDAARELGATPSSQAEERVEASARFAGLVAGGDITAIVTWDDQALVVGMADPMTPWLQPGEELSVENCLGASGGVSINAVLGGRQAWVTCDAPEGFRSAVLLAAPALALTNRLVLVVSLFGVFDKRNLAMASLYLARAYPDRAFAVTRGPLRAVDAA